MQTIGFEGRFDYAAIGTVSNVASRLCDEAKPGQILISPRVFMAVKDAVTALRAVQMALETREAMGALTEKWRAAGEGRWARARRGTTPL